MALSFGVCVECGPFVCEGPETVYVCICRTRVEPRFWANEMGEKEPSFQDFFGASSLKKKVVTPQETKISRFFSVVAPKKKVVT